MQAKTSLLVPLVLAVTLVACAEERPFGSVENPFGAATWRLASGSVDGAALTPIDSAPVTFRVDNGEVGGRSACNWYGGPISITAGAVAIGPALNMTEMACLADGVMDLESGYLAALPRVTTVSREGEDLLLWGEGVELRFIAEPAEVPASLTATTWQLETLIDGETASTPAAEASLLIGEDGAVSGSTGCNQFFGSYDTAAGFSALGATKMACRGEIMEQETTILAILGDDPTLTIEGSRLTIADLGGRALVYRAG